MQAPGGLISAAEGYASGLAFVMGFGTPRTRRGDAGRGNAIRVGPFSHRAGRLEDDPKGASVADALLEVWKKAAEAVALAKPRPRGVPKNPH